MSIRPIKRLINAKPTSEAPPSEDLILVKWEAERQMNVSFREDSFLAIHRCGKTSDQRRELAYYRAGSATVTVAIESGVTLTISEASRVLPAFVPLINT